jgi:hypothetical protein
MAAGRSLWVLNGAGRCSGLLKGEGVVTVNDVPDSGDECKHKLDHSLCVI